MHAKNATRDNATFAVSSEGVPRCPAKVDTWHSDTFVTEIRACDAVNSWDTSRLGDYRPRTAEVVTNPNSDVLVAKFEVCGCTLGYFDPSYESRKQAGAKSVLRVHAELAHELKA